MSLDGTFKTELFWIVCRANNCQYCQGHQESKLLRAGMNEDEIAALDGDWSEFSAAERAIVHGAMPIAGKRPQIVNLNLHQPSFARPPNNPVIERPAKKIRKEGDDVYVQIKTFSPL